MCVGGGGGGCEGCVRRQELIRGGSRVGGGGVLGVRTPPLLGDPQTS